ncbi:hypothetical protein B0H16DRAFT_1885093 [Mycena metata]|uniref:F-box domain-containing protein n=1 Tax=Mycena metata TaxID=1033252 RepID=A0AAD7NFU2_9AGAR|nr:hypothetical protein B0H16DRAFT_1885093 [Mycena metata]
MLSSDESLCCPRCGFPEPVPPPTVVTQSPCSEFLRSNHLPPDAILSNVRREIVIAESGMKEIQEQVCGLKRVLDDLELRRRELQNFVATHKQVLAPIRTLPNEILSEIFMQYVEHRKTGAWLIARVCRSWRETAIASPRLWNRICILTSFGHRANVSGATIKSMLSLQLQRSAQAPLHISLLPDQRPVGTQEAAILEALFSAAYRWHEADLNLQASELRRLIQRLGANGLPASFPQLKKLTRVASSGSFSGEHTLGSVFRNLPVLEELCYFPVSTSSGASLGLQGVPLGQVKKLLINSASPQYDTSASRYNLSDMLDTLQLAPNLVELSLTNCVLVVAPGDGTRTIYLPNLVRVTMSDLSHSLLRYIASPTLQGLRINSAPRSRSDTLTTPASIVSFLSQDSRSDASQASILSFLSQPGLSLTRLELCAVSQSTERLLEILTHTPHLRTLKLYFRGPIDRLFLDALTWGSGERNLVPDLVSLTLEGTFRRCGRDPLVGMLRSRCKPGPLRSVTTYGDGEVRRIPRIHGVKIAKSR